MNPFGVERAECRNCGTVCPADELDRYLWCAPCVGAIGRRAALWGRIAGLTAALALGLWIALLARPGPAYRWLWAMPVVVTYLLVGRIGRAVAVGVYRARGFPRPAPRERDEAVE